MAMAGVVRMAASAERNERKLPVSSSTGASVGVKGNASAGMHAGSIKRKCGLLRAQQNKQHKMKKIIKEKTQKIGMSFT